MVYRIYVEKKKQFADEAASLLSDIRSLLMIDSLEELRIFNRYDVENISEELFERCEKTVFSEPQLDNTYSHLPQTDATVFAVEYLPGQFDQRADSCAQCIQIVSEGDKPTVRTAKVYMLFGKITPAQLTAIKKYVINPVESREASLEKPDTLKTDYAVPTSVETLTGFTELNENELKAFIDKYALAMDLADIEFCRKYFKSEHRDPTITEIRMIDTYWSDHCRHTTFLTTIDGVKTEDETVQKAYDRYVSIRKELGRTKPQNLMDLATIGARYLKHTGELKNLDESDEINACTVKIKVDVDGEDEDWLFLFKNETHNHPTEIEPFGGAATCLGGAIRDPLSGRSYVYQAMRVTGAANPLAPVSETLPGKLPQRKLVTTAAAGYSSYGNQIGLATGQVNELYHPGYVAKRMEIGAVVAATPADHVRRETPAPGDVVVLLGGRTGRDGIGGATGSSKEHNLESLEHCGAEVQKGNPPEERKIQRLFRRGEATRLIKRCNDFGAGGVSVAIGELADGLRINLNKVPKKYEGLDGTELAISESQERMACAIAAADVDEFLKYAQEENLEATVVAEVTDDSRVRVMWNGKAIIDVSREFLASNGAPKQQDVHVDQAGRYVRTWEGSTLAERMNSLVTDLNVCSNKGLSERFDSTIGAATVLMPFGGKNQLTPAQAMVAKLPVDGETTTCSGMAWGFNPYLTEADQFIGSYVAVVESVARLVAAGFKRQDMYLTFQEYFESLRGDAQRWGKPTAAVLGALMAQVDLGIGSIGGKDSMSGSFEQLDVPPTLVSFATAVGKVDRVTSPEFKGAGHRVALVAPRCYDAEGIAPAAEDALAAMDAVQELIGSGAALAVSTPGYGCIAEALFKMCVGNGIGVALDDVSADALFAPAYGSFLVELADGAQLPAATDNLDVTVLGATTEAYQFVAAGETLDMAALQEAWESGIESVYPYRQAGEPVKQVTVSNRLPLTYNGVIARPRVIIPVFPGTNCEYDSARAFEQAGAVADALVINNLTPAAVAESTKALVEAIKNSQIIMLPGGFSGGDEPDGSAKFITAFFRAPEVTEAVRDLLFNRDGLMLGICNGFQALVKLGLVPYGDIRPMDAECPTLTFNTIGRHQSRLVRTRVASNLSPWLSQCEPGDIHTVAISHGEGRFVCNPELLHQLEVTGRIATQYVDEAGQPSMDWDVNPNGSVMAIEGITSPDGRVLGKMGHVERRGDGLYKNVPGNKFMPLFESGVKYFTD